MPEPLPPSLEAHPWNDERDATTPTRKRIRVNLAKVRATETSPAQGTDQSAPLIDDTCEPDWLLNPLEDDTQYDSMFAEVLALVKDMALDKMLPPIEPVSAKQMVDVILRQGFNMQNTRKSPG